MSENIGNSEVVNRRNVLRTLGAGGAGIVGIGTAGNVSADSECTDYRDELDDGSDYIWDDEDSASADNFDCSTLSPWYKVEHGAAILYLNSWEGSTRWYHEFAVTGHAEQFKRQKCFDGSWDRQYGLAEHRANFDTNEEYLSITPEDDEYIKAGPDFDDNGDIPDEYWNYAATGLSIAIGAKSWAVGSGISIAGALRNYVANTDQGGEYDLTYQWGDTGENPVSTPPCGTHFVFQVVEGSDDDGEFKFDFIDEAWGNYPNYTKIEFELDFTDPASPTRTPKYESTSEGDIVTDSKGQDINITEITESVTQFEPTQDSKEIPVEKLPRRIRKRVDIKNGTVTRHRLPATVKKTSIGGKVLER